MKFNFLIFALLMAYRYYLIPLINYQLFTLSISRLGNRYPF